MFLGLCHGLLERVAVMATEIFASVSGFTIERLRVFCSVAESGSIVLAAQGDATRPSQYSRQIKELEEFLRTKLFERVSNSIRLTDNGRKLAAMTHSYFRFVGELRAGSAGEEGIRIGAGESVFRWLLMPRLGALQDVAGPAHLELFTKNTRQSIESVKLGLLDMAIVRRESADDALEALPCGSLSFALVMPRKMLAVRSDNGTRLPPKIPLALHTGDSVHTKGVMALAEKLGVKFDIRVRAESASLLVSAIENADLAAVVPAPALAVLPKDRFASVGQGETKSLDFDLSLVFSPQTARLRENIRRTASRISGLFTSLS
jgi:DNA-binding transcriptional LysR family regulator